LDSLILIFFLFFFAAGIFIGWFFSASHYKMKIKEAEIEKKAAREKLTLVEKLQETFAEQFRGVSYSALKQNNETFIQLAEASFDKKSQSFQELVRPVKETLEKVDGKIQEIEKARTGAYSTLKEQVSSLIETQKELRAETSNLVKALRAPTVRGRWGEIQLKRVVEMAGMVDHCDFYEQASAVTEERRYRPDLLIRLPAGKNIVVDAKAPLDAYLQAIECNDEKVRMEKYKEHASAIRNHISLLSRKSYWEQFQPSPEFVVLFLPGDIFYSAALEHDPNLIEAGVDQKVILATPTILISLLRTVAYGWRHDSLSKNTELISSLGKELYKRISDMSGHWEKLGKSLSHAVQAYNRAVGSLETRVLVSARRFAELGGDKEIDPLEPVEHTPRNLQAPEIAPPEEDI
jgi:DNA recombination protein RmuC